MKLESNDCPQNICNYCVANDATCIGTTKCLVYPEIKKGTTEGNLFKDIVFGGDYNE